jgi:hypothetical protein
LYVAETIMDGCRFIMLHIMAMPAASGAL